MTLRCLITAPSGEQFDASPFLDLAGIGEVSVSPETDLSVMTHGDFSLALDNSSGEVEAFLRDAQPGDLYEVVLERDGDRVFGGILDLPYSLVYDDKAKTASVTAYSFSKVLERTPATTIKRTISEKTASISSGSKTLTFVTGTTDDLAIGDVIKLDAGSGNTAEFTLDKIPSSTQAVTTEAASSTFTAAAAACETPYHRDLSPAALIGLVAAESSIELETGQLTADFASFPVATPLSILNLSLLRTPASLVVSAGTLYATFLAADETNRLTLSSPTGTWAVGAASNAPQGDWRPYLLSEPASILASSLGGTTDTGSSAWDHMNSHVYRVVQEATGSPTFLIKLHLYRDSTDLGIFATFADSDDFNHWIDYDSINDRVWLSYFFDDGVSRTDAVKYYNGSFNTLDATRSGQLRMVRPLGYMAFLDGANGELRFYDPTTFLLARSLQLPTSGVLLWTLRAWDSYFAFLWNDDARCMLTMYETANWTEVVTYPASGDRAIRGFLTPWSFDSRIVIAGHAGGEWFVISTRYEGVVRYADFSDASCAAAARDLAIVTNSLVDVSDFKVLSLMKRLGMVTGEAVTDIGTPIAETRRPISEIYRASVRVTGRSTSDDEIKVTVGDQGESARRLSIDCNLVTTDGMAVAVAVSTLAFVEAIREQRDVDIEQPDTVLRPFQRVLRAGQSWVIYKSETEIETRRQSLTLLEVA